MSPTARGPTLSGGSIITINRMRRTSPHAAAPTRRRRCRHRPAITIGPPSLLLWLVCVALTCLAPIAVTTALKPSSAQHHAGFVATSTLGVGFHQHAFPMWSPAQSAATSDPNLPNDDARAAEPLPLPPRFAHALYNVSIAENSLGKTYAVQPPAEDRMGIYIANDDNAASGDDALPHRIDVRFRIVGGDKEKLFKAEDRRVGDFAFLAIRTRTGNVILNREKIEEYRLEVRATLTARDGEAVEETSTQVLVRVLDTNDLSPMFYPNEYSVAVPEDMQLHRSVIRVVAEDADLGINGEIYYSLLDENDWFAVHPSSGVVTLTRPLKFTDRSFHELVVVATDRGSNAHGRLSQASKAKVHVKVKQVSLASHVSYIFHISYSPSKSPSIYPLTFLYTNCCSCIGIFRENDVM